MNKINKCPDTSYLFKSNQFNWMKNPGALYDNIRLIAFSRNMLIKIKQK